MKHDQWSAPPGSDELYWGSSTVPKAVPEGRILAHNHIMHTARTRHGVRGFRCWVWAPEDIPEHFAPCPCGWSGLPHYARKDHIEATGGRAHTSAEIRRRTA